MGRAGQAVLEVQQILGLVVLWHVGGQVQVRGVLRKQESYRWDCCSASRVPLTGTPHHFHTCLLQDIGGILPIC